MVVPLGEFYCHKSRAHMKAGIFSNVFPLPLHGILSANRMKYIGFNGFLQGVPLWLLSIVLEPI